MGYFNLSKITFIAFLSMQLATSNGTRLCFLLKYPFCYVEFVQGAIAGGCAADQTIQCLKADANECDINNSTAAGAFEQILKLEHLLTEICETGSNMNKAFLQHKACLFGSEFSEASQQCTKKLTQELLKYKQTGDLEKNQKALFKIGCKYTDEVQKCVRDNVKRICGADALSFQKKLSEPSYQLEKDECNGSPASFGLFWSLLLQVSIVVMSLQYFRLTK